MKYNLLLLVTGRTFSAWRSPFFVSMTFISSSDSSLVGSTPSSPDPDSLRMIPEPNPEPRPRPDPLPDPSPERINSSATCRRLRTENDSGSTEPDPSIITGGAVIPPSVFPSPDCNNNEYKLISNNSFWVTNQIYRFRS